MALRSVGKKAYADMVRKVGKSKLKSIARVQGKVWEKLKKQGKLYHARCFTNLVQIVPRPRRHRVGTDSKMVFVVVVSVKGLKFCCRSAIITSIQAAIPDLNYPRINNFRER
jgi:hypothetical protein